MSNFQVWKIYFHFLTSKQQSIHTWILVSKHSTQSITELHDLKWYKIKLCYKIFFVTLCKLSSLYEMLRTKMDQVCFFVQPSQMNPCSMDNNLFSAVINEAPCWKCKQQEGASHLWFGMKCMSPLILHTNILG